MTEETTSEINEIKRSILSDLLEQGILGMLSQGRSTCDITDQLNQMVNSLYENLLKTE